MTRQEFIKWAKTRGWSSERVGLGSGKSKLIVSCYIKLSLRNHRMRAYSKVVIFETEEGGRWKQVKTWELDNLRVAANGNIIEVKQIEHQGSTVKPSVQFN
jgi:hypothetical protein